jgi:hypothetical protein
VFDPHRPNLWQLVKDESHSTHADVLQAKHMAIAPQAVQMSILQHAQVTGAEKSSCPRFTLGFVSTERTVGWVSSDKKCPLRWELPNQGPDPTDWLRLCCNQQTHHVLVLRAPCPRSSHGLSEDHKHYCFADPQTQYASLMLIPTIADKVPRSLVVDIKLASSILHQHRRRGVVRLLSPTARNQLSRYLERGEHRMVTVSCGNIDETAELAFQGIHTFPE